MPCGVQPFIGSGTRVDSMHGATGRSSTTDQGKPLGRSVLGTRPQTFAPFGRPPPRLHSIQRNHPLLDSGNRVASLSDVVTGVVRLPIIQNRLPGTCLTGRRRNTCDRHSTSYASCFGARNVQRLVPLSVWATTFSRSVPSNPCTPTSGQKPFTSGNVGVRMVAYGRFPGRWPTVPPTAAIYALRATLRPATVDRRFSCSARVRRPPLASASISRGA